MLVLILTGQSGCWSERNFLLLIRPELPRERTVRNERKASEFGAEPAGGEVADANSQAALL
jgi:hypothetical protein